MPNCTTNNDSNWIENAKRLLYAPKHCEAHSTIVNMINHHPQLISQMLCAWLHYGTSSRHST